VTGSKKLSGEDRLIAKYFRPLAKDAGALGLLDDAARLRPPAGHDLVVTADMAVAGVHFFADDPADTIAKKALRVNLSDLAAKGAEPLGALLSVSFPENTGEDWLAKFAKGLGEDCDAYKCPLLGGDTTRTPALLTISITAIGAVPTGKMVRRVGAQPGDVIVVTGSIGDAALGLKLRRDPVHSAFAQLAPAQRGHLLDRYLLPQPRNVMAAAVRDHAHAALDVSDGLAGDVAKLAAVSGVRAVIEAKRLPLSEAARSILEKSPELLKTVLTGGDDYELAAAMPQDSLKPFQAAAKEAGVEATVVGRFDSGEGLTVFGLEGKPLELKQLSFSHF
jgi:thiamine-monophosphate kinase